MWEKQESNGRCNALVEDRKVKMRTGWAEEEKVSIEKVGLIICMIYVWQILCMYGLLDLRPLDLYGEKFL